MMRLRRLSWAGVEVIEGDWRILIDPLRNCQPFEDFAGLPRWPLVPVPTDERTWALVTDSQTLCHTAIAPVLAGDGLAPTGVDLWQARSIGPFRVTPVPAQDWRSDGQVSWIVESDARRVCAIHHSLFHNPPHYAQQPEAIGRFFAAGRRRGVNVITPDDGEILP